MLELKKEVLDRAFNEAYDLTCLITAMIRTAKPEDAKALRRIFCSPGQPFSYDSAFRGYACNTRSGRKITEIHSLVRGKSDLAIVGKIEGDLSDYFRAWTENGRYIDDATEHDLDLFMTPVDPNTGRAL